MNDPKSSPARPPRWLVTGARAALAALVLASAWTAVSLGRILRPRAASVS